VSPTNRRRAERGHAVRIRHRNLAIGVSSVAFLIVAIALLPITYPDGDTRFAIAWGSELVGGSKPSFEGLAPIKHPLTLLGGAVVSVFSPQGVIDITAIAALLTFVLLGLATFRLGRTLAGSAAGALAVVIVLTRPDVIFAALAARKDLLFATLVIGAAALIASAPRGHRLWALGLLGAAGLIRPEAWLMAVIYGGWLWWRGDLDLRARRVVAALALSAPVIWVLADLILTGNPFQTAGSGSDRASIVAAGFQEPGAGGPQVSGLRRLAGYLEIGIPGIVGWPATTAAILVAGQQLWRLRSGERLSSPPALLVIAGVIGAMVISGAVLNVFTLPLQDRFLTVAAVAVVILAASSIAGARRTPVLGAALAILVVGVLVALPDDLSETRASAQRTERNRDQAADLTKLLASPRVAQAIADCPQLQIAAARRPSAQFGRATLALVLDVPADDIDPVRDPRLTPNGSVFSFKIQQPQRKATANRRSPKAKTTSGEGSWSLVSAC